MNILQQYQAMLEKSKKGSLLPFGGKQKNLWVPGQGENLIRITPWERDPETLPDNIQRAFTVMSSTGVSSLLLSPFLPVKVHSLGGDLYSCGVTFMKRCPVCAEGSKFWGMFVEGDKIDLTLKEIAKKYFAQDKFISVIVSIKDEKNPYNGAVTKAWMYGKSVFEGIMGLILKQNRNKDFVYGDITDRVEGRLVGFTREGTGRTDTKYKDFFAFEDLSPLPDELEILDPLEEFTKEYPYDEEKIREALKESLVIPTMPSIIHSEPITMTMESPDPDIRVNKLEDIRKLVENLKVPTTGNSEDSDDEVNEEEEIKF